MYVFMHIYIGWGMWRTLLPYMTRALEVAG
jgi:hypothetical protein